MDPDHTQPANRTQRVHPGDDGFPEALSGIPGVPACLYILGRLPPQPRVAVVGSRDADPYGISLARDLGAGLAQAGVGVVSGGAAGVDTAALRGCLEAEGRPVAVLGTGVDVAYPAANRELFAHVKECGALVSEYPEGTPGHPSHFPRRNRIISGLANGVVVVRAAKASGSLITAREAARQGRMVMAVPGPAGDRLSAGVHGLLRKGARLVENVADVLEALDLSSRGQRTLSLGSRDSSIASEERRMLEAIGSEDSSIDALTGRTGLPSHQVASLLLNMELRGLVEQKPGMLYRKSRTFDLTLGEGE